MKMNNYNNKILLIAVIAIFTLFACDDAINVDPADEILESNAITSMEDLELAVVGVYGTVPGIGNVSWNSRFTDELQITTDNNGQGVQVHTWSINSSTTEAEGLFDSYYLPINRANRVLSAISGVPAGNLEEELLKERYRGELLALRGWLHFKLLTFFSPSYSDANALAIPYINYSVVLELPARNTVGEVLTSIGEDLSTAKSLLPITFNTNTFFTKDAVTALQSRVALYSGDNTTAISLSTELIGSYPISTIGDYASIWNDTSDTEVIFKLARVAGDGAIGQIFNPNSALTYFVASDKLFNTYTDDDVRKFVFHIDGTKINKYPAITPDIGLNHIKVFRVSEQYLIRAEAYAKSSVFDLAQADLNMLRSNRILSGGALTITNITEAMDAVLNERYLEFAYEGHRYFDLKRTGSDINRDATDCDILAADACVLMNSDYRFTLPIPQSEIFVNSNMEQNPGYTN